MRKTSLFIFLLIGLQCAADLTSDGFDAYEKGDKEGSIRLHTKACDTGSVISCHELGYIYSNGDGVKADKKKAKALYDQACKGGVAKSCYNLGVMSFEREESSKAFGFFDKACTQGIAEGCYNLGAMYAGGIGVRQDLDSAMTYYGKACDGWDTGGCEGFRALSKRGQDGGL